METLALQVNEVLRFVVIRTVNAERQWRPPDPFIVVLCAHFRDQNGERRKAMETSIAFIGSFIFSYGRENAERRKAMETWKLTVSFLVVFILSGER